MSAVRHWVSVFLLAACTDAPVGRDSEGDLGAGRVDSGNRPREPDVGRPSPDAGASPPDAGAPPDSSPPISGPPLGLVYSVKTGVGELVHMPIGAEGPGPRRSIAPGRAAGFGERGGLARIVAVSPDGRRAVATLDARSAGGSVSLWVLSSDGASAGRPVRLDDAPELRSEYAFSDDSSQLLYLDGRHLFRVPLAGGPSLRLATAPEGGTLTRMRWVEATQRAAFEIDRPRDGQTTATIHSVGLDGTGPLDLTTPDGGQHRIQAVLPDGRLVAMLRDGALHALPSTGGAPVSLTPAGARTSLVGVAPDGQRAIVQLRDGPVAPGRQLVSVATDGSDAEEPVALSSGHDEDLQAVVNADASRMAYVAARSGATWAVFEGPTDGAPFRQIVSALNTRPYLAAYAADGRALVGCAGAAQSEDVVRFDLPGSEGAGPVILVDRPEELPGCPSPDVTADESQVVYYSGGMTPGYAVVPVAGGRVVEPQDLAGAACRSAPGGLFCGNEERRSGLSRAEVDGTTTEVIHFFAGVELEAVHVLPDGQTIFIEYNHDGFHSGVGLRANGNPETMIIQPPHSHSAESWHDQNFVEGDLVRIVPDHRFAGYLDVEVVSLERGVERRFLYDGAGTHGFLDHEGTGVFVVAGGDLLFVPLSGEPVSTIVRGAAYLRSAVYDRVGRQILATRDGDEAIAARVDGSEADAPRVLLVGPPGGIGFLQPTPDGSHAIVQTVTSDTAVPHPLALVSISTDSPGPATPISPDGHTLASTVDAYRRVVTGIFSPDGLWVILRGPHGQGFEAVRVSGEDAAAPLPLVGPVDGSARLRVAPGGHWAVVEGEGGDHLFALDPPASGLPLGGRGAVFGSDGVSLVYEDNDGAVHALRADTYEHRPLTPGGFRVVKIAAVTGDGQVLFTSDQDGDTSLYAVPFDGSAPPRRLTPGDDADEDFVSLVGSDERLTPGTTYPPP